MLTHCSKEEFYDLLRESHAPDSLSFYDDRLAAHMGWKGVEGADVTVSTSSHAPAKL
jgi:hypothetical protein